MRALWLGLLLAGLEASAQVFSPSQEAELRLKYLQSTGGISGTLIVQGSMPADRVEGTGLTFRTQAAGDVTGSFSRLYFNSRAEPRVQGLVLGNATSQVAGTIRFLPSTGALQLYGYSGWVDVGSGTGNGFPLTNDVNAAGFRITNSPSIDNVMRVPGGGADLATNGRAASYGVLFDGTNGYLHAIVPHSLATYDSTNSYPAGQLVYYGGSTYQCVLPLVRTNFNPYTVTNLPIPGASGSPHTNYWRSFALKGSDGAAGAGATGPAGANGLGNLMYYSAWSSLAEYSTNTNTLVRHDGQVYEALLPSTNKTPTLNTSYWAVAVAKGSAGELWGSNLIFRQTFDAGITDYTTNHVVTYGGAMWYARGNVPIATFPPSDGLSTGTFYWVNLVEKGGTGATGPQGPAGADSVLSNITQYTVYLGTNQVPYEGYSIFANNPSAASNMVYYTSSAGGTNYFRWGLPPTSTVYGLVVSESTNATAVTTNSGIFSLNIRTNPASGGSVNWTSTHAVATVGASTNDTVLISHGATGTFFKSTGLTSPPEWVTIPPATGLVQRIGDTNVLDFTTAANVFVPALPVSPMDTNAVNYKALVDYVSENAVSSTNSSTVFEVDISGRLVPKTELVIGDSLFEVDGSDRIVPRGTL